MPAKPIVLSDHAKDVILERKLDENWLALTIMAPEWVEPDRDPELKRHFRTIPDAGGRILRVVCKENDDNILVVTVFLDRRARRP